jgi:hypothetical protein
MKNLRTLFAAAAAATLAACGPAVDTAVTTPGSAPNAARAGQPGTHRQYGTPQKIGNGMVRTYVVLDEKDGRTPIEVGVAMSEGTMDGLPAAMPMSGDMADMGMLILALPAQNPTPYKFVEVGFNPMGHEPAGVYDLPHFDFHFYTVSDSVMKAIVPSDPAYATRAASFPAPEYRAPFYVDAATAAGIPPAAATVPVMGLHWLDVRSPELQKLVGNPAGWRPFTTTFIYGSWDGKFIFDEPMITRAYIMAKRDSANAVRDEIIPVSVAQRYEPAGFYPGAYRITWDAQSKEFRIALTQLAWKE